MTSIGGLLKLNQSGFFLEIISNVVALRFFKSLITESPPHVAWVGNINGENEVGKLLLMVSCVPHTFHPYAGLHRQHYGNDVGKYRR